MEKSIVIIEDDPGVREFVTEELIENRFVVQAAESGAKGLKLIEKIVPDLVILDLLLPDISGETLCAQIKETYPEVTVIILTAKDSTSDIVEGLKRGADDYITKPFQIEELIARINARLSNTPQTDLIKLKDLVINNKTFEVKRGDKKIELTPQEYKLLEYLITNRDKVLTRDMILNRVWGTSADIETRVVDVYIGYLRKKIDKGYKEKIIHSKRGFGYTVKSK